MNEELYIQRGIFIKKKRYIQQKKVQSIDVTAGVFQRLFGLVKIKIETAGGGSEPEVHLIAISKDEASAIRAHLLKKTTEAEEQESVGEEATEGTVKGRDYFWIFPKNHLIIAALTSSGLGLTISAVAALFSQVEQFLPESIYTVLFGFLSNSGVTVIIILVFIVFVIAWAVSFIGTLLKYGNFTIEKFGDELVISRGLLEKRQLTIHAHRITAIRLVRNLLRQPFGFTTVYVESAGGGTNEEQLSTVLLPIVRTKDIRTIFNELIPEYAVEYPVKRVPKRALIRFCFRNTIIPFIATLLIGWFVNPIAYYGFIIVVICLLFGYLQYRDAACGFDDARLWIRYRKISQMIVISKRPKVQSAEIHTSFFQKRRRLASFKFSVLSSVIGKSFLVMDLDKDQANSMLDWYSNQNDIN